MGVRGLISEKTDILYAELNERAEAATGSYSEHPIKMFSSLIFLRRYFSTILIMITEQQN